MAKIAKNTYEFEVNGVMYRAHFEQRHMGRDGQPFRIGSVKAQHMTTCVFATKEMMEGNFGASVGIATCSVKDNYNKSFGMRVALERALLAGGYVNFSYKKVMEGKKKGRHEVVFTSPDDRKVYGQFMHALFDGLHYAEAQAA